MSDRPVGVLVGDMLDRIDRIARYTRGLDHDAFIEDEKTILVALVLLTVIGVLITRGGLRGAGRR